MRQKLRIMNRWLDYSGLPWSQVFFFSSFSPHDVLATLLNNLKVQERQNRVCTTVAIAIVAETCSPFTVLPGLMNEYRVSISSPFDAMDIATHGVLSLSGSRVECAERSPQVLVLLVWIHRRDGQGLHLRSHSLTRGCPHGQVQHSFHFFNNKTIAFFIHTIKVGAHFKVSVII